MIDELARNLEACRTWLAVAAGLAVVLGLLLFGSLWIGQVRPVPPESGESEDLR